MAVPQAIPETSSVLVALEVPLTASETPPVSVAPEVPAPALERTPLLVAPEVPTRAPETPPVSVAPEVPTLALERTPLSVAPEVPTTAPERPPGSVAAEVQLPERPPDLVVPEVPTPAPERPPVLVAPEVPTPAIPERPPFLVARGNRRQAGYAESEDSNAELKLRLRGTFIDLECDREDAEGLTSPRALSDPGSEPSSGYSSYFAKEQRYVAGLSQKVSKTLSTKRDRLNKASARSGNSSGHHTSDFSDSAVGGYERSWTANEESSDMCDTDASAANRGLSYKNSMTPELHMGVRSAVAGGSPKCNFFRRSAMADEQTSRHYGAPASSHSSDFSFEGRPIESTDPSERMSMNHDALRNLVHKKTAEINHVLSYQRLSTALTSINEIPEQVEGVFQQTSLNLLDGVQGEVSVARDLLVNESASTRNPDDEASTSEKAAQSITKIPDMIMASFENSFAKAMSTVRTRVDDVIQGLEGNDMAKDQMVKQMWALPEEVRQITREAVKEASQQSREKVVEQLDCVLQSFSEAEESAPQALWEAKTQIVARVPKKLPDTLRAATIAAEANVCQAIKFVETKCEVTGVVANRVVADTLLRAKVAPRQGCMEEESPGLETLRVRNPGSAGHPELCSRACLYFPLGKCTNGMNCAFCHAPHSKRATHLDKRHREMLRSMEFADRFHLIHPILKSKLQSLDVGPDVMQTLESLHGMVPPKAKPKGGTQVDRKLAKETRTLQIALKFMNIRSLLTLLLHAPMPEDSPQHAAVDSLMQSIRPKSFPTLHESCGDCESQSQKSNGRSRASCRSRTPSTNGSDRGFQLEPE